MLLPLDGELGLDGLELLPEGLDDEPLELDELRELLDELLLPLLDEELLDGWLLLLLLGDEPLDDELFDDELPELLELLADDCDDRLLLLPLDEELIED